MKLNIKKLGLTLSTFFVLGYLVDFFWTYALAGGQQELYLNLLRIFYLKFAGLDPLSFISGLVQIYIWGWVTALVFGWMWNYFHKQ